MDLIYYRSEINRSKEEFSLLEKKTKKTTTIVVALFIIISIALSALAIVLQRYFIFAIIIPLLFIVGIFFIIRYYHYNGIFYNQMHELQRKIFNGEGKYSINKLDKATTRDLLIDLRLMNKYDTLIIYNSFSVNHDENKGYYFNVNISRSNGNSAAQIIKGEIYVLNISSKYNYQIRNDNYGFAKSQKSKFSDYNVYTTENNTELDDRGYYFIRAMFPESKVVGIDYNYNSISVFNNLKYKKPSSFIFSDETVKLHYNYLISKFENLDKIFKEFYK